MYMYCSQSISTFQENELGEQSESHPTEPLQLDHAQDASTPSRLLKGLPISLIAYGEEEPHTAMSRNVQNNKKPT